MVEVTVIGRGPAGLAIAAALAEQGLDTRLVGPAHAGRAPFSNNFGIWTDELQALGLLDVAAFRFAHTEIRLDQERVHRLSRGYSCIDNQKLHDVLAGRFSAAGGRTVEDEVREVTAGAEESHVETITSARWTCRLVVDATGAKPRFLSPTNPAELPAQTALGQWVEVEAHPFALDTMCLMDFSPIAGAPTEPTTFLYAMPLGPGRVFVEETSLSARPPVPIATLETRLERRLAGLGLRPVRVLEVERCFIPMGAPIPRLDQPVFGFGAAASLVHPATGYSVGRSLEAAPRVAAAVRQALDKRAPLAPAAWRALWPPDQVSAHGLLQAGLEILLGLEGAHLRGFFDAFFRRPEGEWGAYLSGRASRRELLRCMRGVFTELPGVTRLQLLRALGRGPARRGLLRAFV